MTDTPLTVEELAGLGRGGVAEDADMKPKRVQRKRTKGWRMPEGAVYVGRPTKWGNPYAAGGVTILGMAFGPQTRADVVRMFAENVLLSNTELSELRGKDLVCWCPLDEPCHADVLLEWANS